MFRCGKEGVGFGYWTPYSVASQQTIIDAKAGLRQTFSAITDPPSLRSICRVRRCQVSKSLFVFCVALAGIFAHAQARTQKNLETCMTGKYPALCDHSILTSQQLTQVRAAEDRENFATCSSGRYRSLCDHSRLSPEQAVSVREAEHGENLRVCLTGRYVAFCDHSMLSSQEAAKVISAENAENARVCLDGRYPGLCNHARLTPDQAQAASLAE